MWILNEPSAKTNRIPGMFSPVFLEKIATQLKRRFRLESNTTIFISSSIRGGAFWETSNPEAIFNCVSPQKKIPCILLSLVMSSTLFNIFWEFQPVAERGEKKPLEYVRFWLMRCEHQPGRVAEESARRNLAADPTGIQWQTRKLEICFHF